MLMSPATTLISLSGNSTLCARKMKLAYSWISCTVISLLQWNSACDILMTLAIKRVHLSYVSTLPDVTQKPKIYVVFFSIVSVVLKRTDLLFKWLWNLPVVWLDHSMCLEWCPFVFMHACSCLPLVNGFVEGVSASARQFLCNVR